MRSSPRDHATKRTRRPIGLLPKVALHRVNGSKPAFDCDLLHTLLTILQQPFSSFNSQSCHELGWGRAEFAREVSRKVTNTHTHPGSELIHAERLTQILHDPYR